MILKILQMWSVDSKIDEILLDRSSHKIPSLPQISDNIVNSKLKYHKAES